MSNGKELYHELRWAFTRNVAFALELVDPITLGRVTEGIEVIAVGLRKKPIQNYSGIFVWRDEPLERFERIEVRVRNRPFEDRIILRSEVEGELVSKGLISARLVPLPAYPFPLGSTVLLGRILKKYESLVSLEGVGVKTKSLEIEADHLIDNRPQEDFVSLVSSSTHSGEFASVLRWKIGERPKLDEHGFFKVKLFFRMKDRWRVTKTLDVAWHQVSATGKDKKRLDFVWDELVDVNQQ